MNQVIAWVGFLGAWLLLPPVLYLIRRHRRHVYRQAAFAQLTPAQRDQFSAGEFG
jgi:hypothetical protein